LDQSSASRTYVLISGFENTLYSSNFSQSQKLVKYARNNYGLRFSPQEGQGWVNSEPPDHKLFFQVLSTFLRLKFSFRILRTCRGVYQERIWRLICPTGGVEVK